MQNKMKFYVWQYLLAGLYAWMVSVFSGAVLLDIVYSNVVYSMLAPSQTDKIFSEGADFLLLIGVLVLFLGIVAVLASWGVPEARNLFIASVTVVAMELAAPVFFFPLLRWMQASLGVNLGPWIRLSAGALSSILALLGLWKLYTAKS